MPISLRSIASWRRIREEIHKKILPLSLKGREKNHRRRTQAPSRPHRRYRLNGSSNPLTQHRKIAIYVNRADLRRSRKKTNRRSRKLFDHLESFSCRNARDIEPGGCMIETEAGIINAQLENQWRALEAAFESFMKK